MRVSDLVEAIESVAPTSLAEDWDRVGLQIGRPAAELSGPVLLTIDLTEEVAAEAIGMGASAILAYHPPIFRGLDELTDATAKGRILLGLIEKAVAVYSPHTALDAATGGVTDWLCEGVAGAPSGRIAGDVRALTPDRSGGARVKIVTFVPEADAEKVRNAMATAGAGQIGNYKVCSFATPGEGTFLGGAGTDPVVGHAGKLEQVPELRLEMVAPARSAALVVETLREFHPYEEPPVDVYPLEPEPRRGIGAGRRLTLDSPATLEQIGARLREHLRRSRLRFALPEGRADDEPFRTVGVVPGSGSELADTAIGEGCELFVTGEMKHHEVVGATQRGLSILLAGHTNTERGYLSRLAPRLSGMLGGHEVRVSEKDRDPIRVLP
ncbi:MAG: Nif3-like dinuclear metal center hexameric protein [Planctomycetota bacterium]